MSVVEVKVTGVLLLLVWPVTVEPDISVRNRMFCSPGWGWLPVVKMASPYAVAIKTNVAKAIPMNLALTNPPQDEWLEQNSLLGRAFTTIARMGGHKGIPPVGLGKGGEAEGDAEEPLQHDSEADVRPLMP
jgi:hypothetical protein